MRGVSCGVVVWLDLRCAESEPEMPSQHLSTGKNSDHRSTTTYHNPCETAPEISERLLLIARWHADDIEHPGSPQTDPARLLVHYSEPRRSPQLRFHPCCLSLLPRSSQGFLRCAHDNRSRAQCSSPLCHGVECALQLRLRYAYRLRRRVRRGSVRCTGGPA